MTRNESKRGKVSKKHEIGPNMDQIWTKMNRNEPKLDQI